MGILTLVSTCPSYGLVRVLDPDPCPIQYYERTFLVQAPSGSVSSFPHSGLSDRTGLSYAEPLTVARQPGFCAVSSGLQTGDPRHPSHDLCRVSVTLQEFLGKFHGWLYRAGLLAVLQSSEAAGQCPLATSIPMRVLVSLRPLA